MTKKLHTQALSPVFIYIHTVYTHHKVYKVNLLNLCSGENEQWYPWGKEGLLHMKASISKLGGTT